MLSNSIIAGGLASGYLTVVMLQVNPAYPLSLSALAPMAVILGAAYGANLTVAFYALIVLRQILAVEVLSPGWLSVRLLSWLFTMAASGGAALMWLNLRGLGPVLDIETNRRIAAGAVVVSAAAAVFMTIALAHIGRRGGPASAATLVITAALSVAIPAGLRGPGRPVPVAPAAGVSTPTLDPPAAPDDARLTMVLLDGASLDVIAPAVAEGRLPNLGRIFDRGAVRHLATLRPTQAEPVWSAVATGRLPMQNGVRSAANYRPPGTDAVLSVLPDYCFAQALVRFGFLAEERHTSADLIARPLWRILSDQGVSVGVIGWPLTDPAAPVRGFMISDGFHRLTPAEMALDRSASVWPPTLLDEARAARGVDPDPDPVSLVSMLGGPPAGGYDLASDPAPVAADRVHVQLLQSLDTAAVRFLAVRLPGIDAVGHHFLRYAAPFAFGDVSDEERRRLGAVLERYYGFIDALAGRLLDALGPDDVLLVVSAFGMEPLSPGKRVLERLVGNPEISGTHERAPDGFVLAYGGPIQPGRPPRSSVVDLTPTILYFFGLPVGRDMEGFARTDLFTARFTDARPVTYIPSYGQ
jgi:hypothetical protein